MQKKSPQDTTLTPGKKRIFVTVTLLTPLVFLVLLELTLRVFNYGVDVSLFRQHDVRGRVYLQMNPDVKYRYFGTADFQPSSDPTFFQVPKPEGTFRIFVLGESTTAGYPYWYNGAFPAYLQTRLETIFPERKIEIINLGMTATNSYTALDIAEELSRYQPDIVIYYGGHNEFYGALGAASNLSAGSFRILTETYLRLVHLRTFQLVVSVIHDVAKLFGGHEQTYSRSTEMEKVARGKLVPIGSPLYNATFSIFKKNLAEMRDVCRSNGIPLIVGTQVSDLRDQPPFVSENSPGVTGSRKAEFERHYKKGVDLESTGKWDSASVEFRSAIGIDSLYADAQYKLAKCLDTTGHKTEALSCYVLARDYDELRFRTDSNFNGFIRTLDDGKTCYLADVERMFEGLSPDSLIGHNLILEHLHPNSTGAFYIAKCYAEAMREHGILASREEWNSDDTVSDRVLWQNRLVTAIDESMTKYSVDWLTSGWPFKNQPPSLEQVPRSDTLDWISEEAVAGKISWVGAHMLAAEYYKKLGNWNEVARIYRSLVYEARLDLSLYPDLAEAYLNANELRDAFEVTLNYVALYPALQGYKSLGDMMMRLAKPDSAAQFYQKMDDFAVNSSERISNGMIISYAFAKAGEYANAKARLTEILAESPDYPPAKRLLDDINAIESSSGLQKK